MEQEVIQFIGLKDLEEVDQAMVQKLTTEYYQKIKRAMKNITSLTVHIKEYKKVGGRSKYSLNIRVSAPTKQKIESEKATDWDLARALHKGFKDLENQMRHRLRSDDQRPK